MEISQAIWVRAGGSEQITMERERERERVEWVGSDPGRRKSGNKLYKGGEGDRSEKGRVEECDSGGVRQEKKKR